MTYTIQNPDAGYLPIANIDSGTTFANAAAAGPTPPGQLGMIVTAIDPTYGAGEFIMLLGVASTAIGTVVTYNASTYLTSIPLISQIESSGEPMAVAMSANLAGTWGWYQISGTAVCKKGTTYAVSANKPVGYGTLGVVTRTVTSGKQFQNAKSGASVASAATTVTVVMNRIAIVA
jgi:hypothetical protein